MVESESWHKNSLNLRKKSQNTQTDTHKNIEHSEQTFSR